MIEEILHTEEAYVADLKLVVEVRFSNDVMACSYDIIMFLYRNAVLDLCLSCYPPV